MLIKNYTKNIEDVFISDKTSGSTFFEKQYHLLRVTEHRIFSDDELAKLPDTNSFHQYHHEWEIRKKSSIKFINYLKQKNKHLKILDIGCGNGWLSNKLAAINKSEVAAIDLNYEELKQASRVFKKNENIFFIHGNIDSLLQSDLKFDIILFSASIQYFSSLKEIINKSVSILNNGGEIHIIDSPLYKPNKIIAANERSKKYFTSIGFVGMNDFYFHHSLSDLKNFNFKILFRPYFLKKYLFPNSSSFYWICIFNNNLFKHKV